MAKQPKAILFDLDNTLTDRRASVTAFARQFYVHFRSRHQMTRFEDIEPIIHLADDGGYRPLDERWRMLQDRILWKGTPSVDELRDYWYTELGRCAIGVAGLHDTLLAFRDRQIQLGIITNGLERLQNLTVDTLKIRQYMDTVIVSDTVGVRKPDSAIYELALHEVDQVADDVWFVGDNPDTDILGAYHMGMTTVWIEGYHDWTDDSFVADYTVDNISEMLMLF